MANFALNKPKTLCRSLWVIAEPKIQFFVFSDWDCCCCGDSRDSDLSSVTFLYCGRNGSLNVSLLNPISVRLSFSVLLLCCILSIVTHYPAVLHPLTLECPSHNTKVIGQIPFRFAPSLSLRSLLGLLISFNPPFTETKS